MKVVSIGYNTVLSLLRLDVSKRSRLLIAVSGGVDSTSLLHIVAKERDRYAALGVVHVNHQLRGEESDLDELFVKELCDRLGIPCFVKRVQTGENAEKLRKGIEETAREDRYTFFQEIAREHGFDTLVTAHTKNDQAETLIMRLLRGAGPRGLAGIPKVRQLGDLRVVRPWLDVTREEIEQFAEQQGIEYRTDSTNAERLYTRNRIRHEVLPLLKSIGGEDVINRLAEAASLFREQYERTSHKAEEAAKLLLVRKRNRYELDLSARHELSDEVLHLLLERSLASSLGERYYLEREPFERLKQFIEEGEEQDWEERLRLKIENGILGIKKKSDEGDYEYPLVLDGSVATPFGILNARVREPQEPSVDKHVSEFDLVFLTGNLIVRNWRAGETIEPFGLDGKKNISKLLTDARISAWEGKGVYPVLALREGDRDTILSVPGIRRSRHAALSANTKAVLEVRFEPVV